MTLTPVPSVSDDAPPKVTRAVPTPLRAEAGELSALASRICATLDRPWAYDAALDRLDPALIDMAERVLALRRHVAEWRAREVEIAGGL